MNARTLIAHICLLLVTASGAWAGTTGKISGTVKDARTQEPLIGVNVVVEGTTLGASTDLDGYYVILNVPPGTYTVRASALGYTPLVITNVAVKVDLTTKVEFALQETVLQLGEEVIVRAERQVVRKDLTSSESRVDAAQMAVMPTREVGEVLSLQAGVTTGQGGEIHIRGGRASEVGYWINGVSVSDVFDNSQAVRVDNNSIQELQVISGTFNAEYGQAMSGIVNIVTKDGDREYRGGLQTYTSSYVTSDPLYYHLSPVRPFNARNLEGFLSGPAPLITGTTFYASLRYFRSDGYLWGQRAFHPDGSLAAGTDSITDASGNLLSYRLPDAPVPMNPSDRWSGQFKLSSYLASTVKLTISGLGSIVTYKDYSHDWRLVPDGNVTKYDQGYNVGAQLTHTLGSTTFYTVNATYFRKDFKEYLYADPFDPRYQLDPFLTNRGLFEFLRAGTNLHQFRRTTETQVLKVDLTSQISRYHQVKLGVEAKQHRLWLRDFSVTPVEDTSAGGGQTVVYKPTIPPASSPLYQEYTRKPIEVSAYVQDKIEYESMIVNVGVRFDYFDARGTVLADPQDPNVFLPQKPENQPLTLEERRARWYRKTTPKWSVSPRLGISYPITDQGVLHFSYGHFLQVPSFANLYQNADYKVNAVDPIQGVFGNSDLRPQKTVMYEFGLQQQIVEGVRADITGFYRDTRDWVGVSPLIPVRDASGLTATTSYTMFVNKDYANSRGVTLTVDRRGQDGWSFDLSYTFQVAEGSNSNADEEQGALLSNREPSKQLTALDWDQTHTLNVTTGLSGETWGAFVIGRYGSGLPYTPVINQAEGRGEDAARVVQKNSRRRPDQMTVDLRTYYSTSLAGFRTTLYLKVFNLLDRRNEVVVFGQTGRSYATLRQLGVEGLGGINRVNDAADFIARPDFYGPPREIEIGFDINF